LASATSFTTDNYSAAGAQFHINEAFLNIPGVSNSEQYSEWGASEAEGYAINRSSRLDFDEGLARDDAASRAGE
jgi:hypothetical protein